MLEQEFDRFADEYEQMLAPHIGASGENVAFFAEYKAAAMRRHIVRAENQDLGGKHILDFGCGVGTSLPYLHSHFPRARLTGADVSSKSLAIAAQRFPGVAELVNFRGGEPLPISDASVDASFTSCVFHHIPENQHGFVLRDLLRVVKPGGWLFIFEHNPFNPLTVNVVKACAFDENAVLIRAGELRRRVEAAGFADASIEYRLFLPGALRRLRPLEAYMGWCPLGAQYYVAARRP